MKRGSFSSGRNLCNIISFEVRLLQPIHLWPLIFGTQTLRSYTTTMSMESLERLQRGVSLHHFRLAQWLTTDRPTDLEIGELSADLKVKNGTHLPADTGTNSRCMHVLLKVGRDGLMVRAPACRSRGPRATESTWAFITNIY